MHAERFESALWQTSSLLLAKDGEAVLVDPCISTQEVARIAARVDELGARVVSVLATHADWDHVCGIAAFPDAEAAMGEASAARLESGKPWERVQEAAKEYRLEVPGPPRVDRALEVGRAHRVGPFTVETIPLPGHAADGVGYRIRELDLLAVGDYLSAIEFPFVSSPAAYRATLAGLIELLRRDPPARVVVGHGPEHTPADALEIAQADLDYLWRLHDAVLRSVDPPDPPRPCADDLAEMLGSNVDAQRAELAPRTSNRTSTGRWNTLRTHAAASSVAPIALPGPRPSSQTQRETAIRSSGRFSVTGRDRAPAGTSCVKPPLAEAPPTVTGDPLAARQEHDFVQERDPQQPGRLRHRRRADRHRRRLPLHGDGRHEMRPARRARVAHDDRAVAERLQRPARQERRARDAPAVRELRRPGQVDALGPRRRQARERRDDAVPRVVGELDPRAGRDAHPLQVLVEEDRRGFR